ncbi:hypothetical protein [Tsukamurella ocularis]|uniref:hypothetical protein n=1 Tax=Tsukamurella ocularis TaxID=1970234 RepID=UPI002166D319|nr:hypothetical protein [Tsukamurella ocularis]MCS3779378.1 hypothetical protein [Tsukamurella ocularis]MCS3789892.1 hypothetical protein [Tsukamurella ocularis]
MDETPKSLIPTESVVAPSLDAVSPERRAAALQAVSEGRTWAWELGPTSLPKPQHRKLLNRAALPADVRTKIDAIEAAGMFVDVGGEVIGDAPAGDRRQAAAARDRERQQPADHRPG